MKNLLQILTQGFGKLNPDRFFYFITLPFFACLLLFSYYQHFHGFIDRDTPSYIEIAIKYQQGQFYNAINGYWSPLYSWLLAPLLYTGLDPDKLLGYINVAASALILFQLFKLIKSFSLLFYLDILLQVSFALALALFCFLNITPDLLNIFSLVVYLRMYLNKQIFKQPVLTGVIGALLYFSKYYTFSFFLVHISFVYLVEIFFLKQKLLKSYFKTLAFFLILSSVWITLLSVKYNRFLLSYSGSYNHSIMESGFIHHTWENKGFVAPYKNNLFPWEDIAMVYQYKDWSPFECEESFNNQVFITKNNLNYFFKFVNADTRYGFYLNLVILTFIIIKSRRLKLILDDATIKMMLFGLIYVSGYLLVLLCNDRYIWIIYFLSALSIAVFFNSLLKNQKNIWVHIVCIIFLLYCFNKKHIDVLVKYFEKDFDSLPQNISLFKKTLKPSDRVISYEPITAGHFPIDTRSAYYGNCLGYQGDTLAILRDLKKYKITYAVSADTLFHIAPELFNHFKKVEEPFTGLKLYKIDSSAVDSLYNDMMQRKTD